MQVSIVGNENGSYRLLNAADNSQTLGFSGTYSGCLLIARRNGWTVAR